MDLETAQALASKLNLILQGCPFHASETVIDGGPNPDYIVGVYDAPAEAPRIDSEARSEQDVQAQPPAPDSTAQEQRARPASVNGSRARGDMGQAAIEKSFFKFLMSEHRSGGEGIPSCYWEEFREIFQRHGVEIVTHESLQEVLDRGGAEAISELSKIMGKIHAHKKIRRLITDELGLYPVRRIRARSILRDHVTEILGAKSYPSEEDQLHDLLDELGPTRTMTLLRRLEAVA